MSDFFSNSLDIDQKAIELYELFPKSNWNSKLVKVFDENKSKEFGIACSGGADSIFLLLLIYAAFPDVRERITVLHYNHRLREAESDSDQAFVRDLTCSLNLKFKTQDASDNTKSDEGTLRNQRRLFFLDAMSHLNQGFLLLGHNLDDIAETFLWRIPRGVGTEGLCSPKPIEKLERFLILRPILNLTREAIRLKLSLKKIPWRTDRSNQDSQYLRNRLRANTLSLWKTDSDRDLMKGVDRTRELMEEQAEALNFFSLKALEESKDANGLNYDKLSAYPRAVIRKVLTNWIVYRTHLQTIHQYTIDQILNSLKEGLDSNFTLSQNLSLKLKKNTIFLTEKFSKTKTWGTLYFPFETILKLPSGFFLSAVITKLSKQKLHEVMQGKVQPSRECYLSVNSVLNGLYVRQRKEGDKFKPLGLNGTKKIKDLMIDQKWNQFEKENTPIVTNSEGKILWLPGSSPDQSTAIDYSKTKVIHLTYKRSSSL